MTLFNFQSNISVELLNGSSKGIYTGANSEAAIAQGATVYNPIGGQANLNSTVESIVQVTIQTAVTGSNLRITVIANTITAASTAKLRINSADGTQAASITASTTGSFEDTTGTDSLVAGNVINFSITGGSGGTQMQVAMTTMLFTGSSGSTFISPLPYILNQSVNRSNTF